MPTNFYASKLYRVKTANSTMHVKTPILYTADYCLRVYTSSFASYCSRIASASALIIET